MNQRILWAIAEKDLIEVRKNRIVVFIAIVLTIMFSVILPTVFTQMPTLTGSQKAPQLEELGTMIPKELLGIIKNLDPSQMPVVLFVGYLFAPLFLIIPLMLASIIAAEAFVGEKERKTLEALLYTPATDLELFMGKVLASVIPAMLFAWVNFAIYAAVANITGWPLMHRIWFPTEIWWIFIFWLTPALSLLGVATTVLVSSKVNTFMEAYQASGALVIVVIVLLLGQIFGLIFLSTLVTFFIGAGFFVLDAALILVGVRIFQRSELIAKI